MKILVVGSGGREHALCLAIRRSPLCDALLCAPGNAGIAAVAACRPVAADDVHGIVALAQSEKIGLVVIGPEAPLVAGLVDRLEAAGILAFGPRAAAARLEGSKAFMKEVCDRARIPTAAWGDLPMPRMREPSSASVARRSWSRRMDWRPAKAWWWPRPSTKPWPRSTG